jgi:hypothetical protein
LFEMHRQMLRALLPRLQHTFAEPAARAHLGLLLRATEPVETLQHVFWIPFIITRDRSNRSGSTAVKLLQVLPEMIFAAKGAFGNRTVCADGKIVDVMKVRGRDIGLAAEGACLR